MARKKKQKQKNIDKSNKPRINLKKAASIANDALEFCRSGDYKRGIMLLHKAEQRAENNNQIYFNLAIAYHAIKDYQQAQKYYYKAIQANPDNAVKILQRGISELALNKIESSECCINAVSKIDPDNITTRLATASINLRKNNREVGAEIMRQCYRQDLRMTSAIMELAEFGELTADDIDVIISNIADNLIEEKSKKFTFLALAKGYDCQKNFDEAYSYYKKAQELFAAESKLSNYQAVNDLQGHLAAVKQNIDRAFIDKFFGQSSAGKNMVFIVGLPGSGLHQVSFLLQQSVNAEIHGELNWCNEKIFNLLQANNNSFSEALATIDNMMLANLTDEYLKIIRNKTGSKGIHINCKITNFVNVWFIRILFPQARIIYARRNFDDQILSAYFNNAPGMEYLNELLYVKEYCRLYGELMDYWLKLFDDGITVFDYDEFLSSPEEAYSKLISSVPLDKADLKFSHALKPSLNVTEVYTREIPLHKAYEKYLQQLAQENPLADFSFDGLNLSDQNQDTSGFKLNFDNDSDDTNKSDEGFKLKFD